MIEIYNFQDLIEVINQEVMVIIVRSNNCSVCKTISARLELMMHNFPLYNIYIEKVREFSGQFLVFTTPAILIFSQRKEILREARFINFKKIEKLLQLY